MLKRRRDYNLDNGVINSLYKVNKQIWNVKTSECFEYIANLEINL